MKLKFGKIILLLLFFCSACKKIGLPDPPLPSDSNFYLNADINGQALSLVSGEDNYFMFSEFKKDSLDVYSFIGRLEQLDCGIECREKLTIIIRDEKEDTGAGVNIDSTLILNSFSYASSDNTTVELVVDTLGFVFNTVFDASQSILPLQGNIFYTWDFDSGLVVTSLDPIVSNTFLPNPMGNNFPINLTIADNNGLCSSTQTQTLSFANDSIPACSVSIVKGDSLPNPTVSTLSAKPTGVPPYSYVWNTGQTSSDVFVSPNLQFYEVTVTDATGCTSTSGLIAGGFMGGSNLNCLASFEANTTKEYEIDSMEIVTTDNFQFSTIELEYTDENGTVFNSKWGPQNAMNASFEIISVEDFEDNENGMKTKQLTLQFECQLFSQNGDIKNLTNGEAVIAIAYP